MPRIPTRDSLSQGVPRSTGGIVSAPRDFIGPALATAGVQISREAEHEKKQQGSLELIKARSEWNTALTQESASYTLDQNPDYGNWSKKYETNARNWQQKAAANISDPELRQKFTYETNDDLARTGTSIKNNARQISVKARLTAAYTGLDQLVNNAATMDDKGAKGVFGDIKASLQGMVDVGLLEKEEAAQQSIKYARDYAALKVNQDILSDPIGAFHNLSGSVTDNFKKKVRRRESGGRDSAKNPNSSATGRYQFTKGTWLDLMKSNPGLGLTANGRGDAEQQERAMDALIDQNGKALKAAGLPVNEATLYTAHFMGTGGAVELLSSEPGEDAAAKFPQAAAANKTIFYNRDGTAKSVGQVVQNLSKGFSSQGGAAPKYYSMLDADTRIQFSAAAESAADKRLDDLDKEARIDEARSMVDYAVEQFGSRTEAGRYIKNNASDPAVREDALSALDAEYRRRDDALQKARVEQYDTTFTNVQGMIEAGDLDGARKAVPADMPGEERRKLLELINKGPATTDKSEVYSELQALRMSDPKSFAEVDLRKHQTDLTASTIDSLHAAQQTLKKDNTKYTSLQNADAMLKDEMRTMGIVLGSKATEADIRYAQRIRAMAAPEIERREEAKGKQLTTRELQEVIDDTFVSFKGTRAGYLYSSEETITAVDVMKDYNEIEDDENMIVGDLMDKALRQFKAVNPNITPTPEMLYDWLQKYKNRKQTNG